MMSNDLDTSNDSPKKYSLAERSQELVQVISTSLSEMISLLNNIKQSYKVNHYEKTSANISKQLVIPSHMCTHVKSEKFLSALENLSHSQEKVEQEYPSEFDMDAAEISKEKIEEIYNRVFRFSPSVFMESDCDCEKIENEKSSLFFPIHILTQMSSIINVMKEVNQLSIANDVNTQKISTFTGASLRQRSKKYQMFSSDFKKQCTDLADQKGLKNAARMMNVPIKSLKRWLLVGCQRKKGGGRKAKDPVMEKRLYNWYKEYHMTEHHPVTASMMKSQAIELASCKDFIASKGWLEKFKKKYHLEISKESSIRNKSNLQKIHSSKDKDEKINSNAKYS